MSTLPTDIRKLIAFSKNVSVSDGVVLVSTEFLGRPFHKNPCNDQPDRPISFKTFSRTDQFDCLTFVEVAIAITKAHTTIQFVSLLKKIRFRNNRYTYLDRNHFIHGQWLPNNHKKGLIKPAYLGLPTKTCTGRINLTEWLIKSSKTFEKAARGNQRHLHPANTISYNIKYIPVDFFSPTVVSKIKSGTIACFVSENTVKHIGFIVRINNETFIRHCGPIYKKVTDDPFNKYISIISIFNAIQGIALYSIMET